MVNKRRRIWFGAFSLALFLGGGAAAPLPTQQESHEPGSVQFTLWAKQHAIPLKTAEAGNGFEDMQPLGSIVDGARIIALGEATHGTHEFFQFKHRMLEFMATRSGSTVFAIEANMPEAQQMNDFVVRGQGDPKQLLKDMHFWTWDTREVLDMILWMRQFNQSGKGHVEFTGFDMQYPGMSVNTVESYLERYDPTYLTEAKQIYDKMALLSAPGARNFGLASATFPIAVAAAKHIEFSGFIRTENVENGYAGLWWRVDGKLGSAPLAFDNMHDRGVTGSTPWTQYKIALDVPADATHINFGVLHTGSGTAWFDSLEVKIDGVRYEDANLFDFDFESATAKGFFTGGIGYRVGLDRVNAHTGIQSLRSEHVNAQSLSEKDRSGDKLIEQGCKQILRRIEHENAQNGSDDLAWVTQNARLLVEYMQLRLGQQSRDESMAENVEWIAKHSHGAKVVLWAHNSHVAYGGYGLPDSMGEFLHKMFGDKLVNFGFVFGDGSFRSILPATGLKEFSVGPSPEGTLDRQLQDLGLPIFALDVRKIPSTGLLEEWRGHPHLSKSVGAIYDPASSLLYFSPVYVPGTFDVLLFISHTTASRAN